MEAIRIPLSPLNFKGNMAENWKAWVQKFEIYSTATELDEKAERIQCAQLLHCMGEEAITIFNTFVFTNEEENKIEPLKLKFKNYFTPKRNLTYERYKFFTSRQESNQNIEQFVTELKNKAKQCEFGEINVKDDLIKTMIIIGIKDEALRAKLLENEHKNIEQVIECCIMTENSRKNLRMMQDKEGTTSTATGEIDAINRKPLEKNSTYPSHQGQKHHHHHQRSSSKARYGNKTSEKRGQTGKIIKECSRCGREHLINQCPAFGKSCNNCKYLNHFANMCKNQNKRINSISYEKKGEDSVVINSINSINNYKHCNITLVINNNKDAIANFKVDTGASVNIISVQQLQICKVDLNKIKKSEETLTTYTGEIIPIVGKCHLNVKLKEKCLSNVEFYVIRDRKESILGINSCIELGIIELHKNVNFQTINLINDNKKGYADIIEQNRNLFEGIGKINKPYHIEIKENVKPIVNPVRKVPFALQNQLKECLDNLVKSDIIEREPNSSEWVNSFVLVKKADNSLRICLDPKHLNEAIKPSKYKLPNIDEISAKLNGSTIFTKLDATSGFWTIPLDKESSKLCTFGTPYGRYKFLRMPFGINIASEVFQEYFSNIFSNTNGVEIYIDDILVHAKTKEEHDKTLKKVFDLAKTHNIKFNLKKCQFEIDEVNYLGFKFSRKGISIDEEKIEAIQEIPIPKNKKEIQIFLGMITYVSRFIKNLSELTKPLRDLLKLNTHFEWGPEQNKAFEKLKSIITSEPNLKFYDTSKPITISVDASSYGLGAVLLQDNKPCAYASRAMTENQCRYAQIEKELLAICFGLNKFYQYTFGRKTTIETDHKPLIPIFKKPLYSTPARLQRMLLSIQKFDIQVIYKPGKELIIADALSRININKQATELELEEQICVVNSNIQITDRRRQQLVDASENDEILKTIKQYIENAWPKNLNKTPVQLKHYYKLKNEITYSEGLLYLGHKIIIPKAWQNKILDDLHTGHLGIKKCISRAKCAVYWHNINVDIENLISRCEICNKFANSKTREPMIAHEIIKKPWQKVGMDIFELNGVNYLIVVDYYSKFPEIMSLNNNLTANNVINKLKSIFARHGIPKVIISDSGRQFTSKEMDQFSLEWNFQIIHSSPHYQQSNGQAERTIQTMKKIIKKCHEDKTDLYLALLAFRNTPILNSTYSPSQILMSRYLRDNLIFEDKKLSPKKIKTGILNKFLSKTQDKNINQYNKKCVRFSDEFKINDLVWYQDSPKSTWKKAQIISKLRERTYKIVKEDGRCLIRNSHYIKHRKIASRHIPTSSQNHVFTNMFNEKTADSEVISEREKSEQAPLNTTETITKRIRNRPLKFNDYQL